MAKTREQKKNLYDSYIDALKDASSIFVVDTSNLSATQLTDIKIKLIELGSKFMIIKNTVFEKAHESSNLKDIKFDEIEGPSGVFFVGAKSDPSAVAKIIKEFQKDYELLKTKFGLMDGTLLTPEQIKTIADLPTKDELLAKTVYVIAGPIRNLIGVMNGATRDLVGVLKAIKDQK